MQDVQNELSSHSQPKIALQISLYYDTPAEHGSLPDLKIVARLPHGRHALKSIYCRANDSPCLRGGCVGKDMLRPCLNVENARQASNFSLPWSIRAEGSPLQVIRSSSSGSDTYTERAPDTVKRLWNIQCDTGRSPPWLSPEQGIMPAVHPDGSFKDSYARPMRNHAEAEKVIQHFANDMASHSTFLICPASFYGWDLATLQGAMEQSLRQEGLLHSDGQFGNILNRLLGRFSSIKVGYLPVKPALVRQRINSYSLMNFYKILYFFRDRPRKAAMGTIALSIGIFVLFVRLPLLRLVILPTIALLAIWMLRLFIQNVESRSFHEALGVAWALSYWVETSAGFDSVEKVFATFSSAQEVKQLRNGKYVVRIGSNEIEWWAANGHAILDIIRRGERGTIYVDSAEAPSDHTNHGGMSLDLSLPPVYS